MGRHSKRHAPASGAACGALAALVARLPAGAARVAVAAVIMEDGSSWDR
jgi:hypothetical protein